MSLCCRRNSRAVAWNFRQLTETRSTSLSGTKHVVLYFAFAIQPDEPGPMAASAYEAAEN